MVTESDVDVLGSARYGLYRATMVRPTKSNCHMNVDGEIS